MDKLWTWPFVVLLGFAELQALDPYPQTPDDPIAFEDYRATLVVRKR